MNDRSKSQKKNLILLILSILAVPGLGAGWYYAPRLIAVVLLILGSLVLVWSLARFIAMQPLRGLLNGIIAVRLGKQQGPIQIEETGLIEQLAWEYNHLYSALIQTRADVERAVAAVERREYHNTKDFHQTIRYLEKTANTDKLTGLSNRGQLNQYLDTYMQKALQAETDLTCLMIDMDNFKEINDSYGHGVGDTLLVFLGDLLRAFSREEDLAIRYGGDEFVLLLQDCSFEDARAVAERICKLFAKESVHCLPVNKNYSGQVHQNQMDTLSGPDNMIPYLSIGLASVRNNHCQDPQQLLELADKALYQAKQKGRNCVVVSNGGD